MVYSAAVVLFCVVPVGETFYTQVTLQFVPGVLFHSNYALMRGPGFVDPTLSVAVEDVLAGSARLGRGPAAGGVGATMCALRGDAVDV